LVTSRIGAIADFTEAARINPGLALAFINRAFVYWHEGAYDSAIADYTEAIRLNPELTRALHERGVAYFFKGNFPAAAEDLSRMNEVAVTPYPVLSLSRSRANGRGRECRACSQCSAAENQRLALSDH
jgi:tetratricopeptide (TPR) repeat protein